MASDDHDERVRGALAVALIVFLNLQETAPSQNLGRVGSGFGRARWHGDDGPASMAMVPGSNALGKSTPDRISSKRRGLHHSGKQS